MILKASVEDSDGGLNRQLDHRTFYLLTGAIPGDWHPAMLVADSENDADFEAIAREVRPNQAQLQLLANYRHKAGVWGVRAHDSRQNFALNLLLDDDIDLVTIAGSAGTGKTFMALAAAFQQTLDTKRFERIVFYPCSDLDERRHRLSTRH